MFVGVIFLGSIGIVEFYSVFEMGLGNQIFEPIVDVGFKGLTLVVIKFFEGAKD